VITLPGPFAAIPIDEPVLGWGSRLVRLEVASELAGRRGVAVVVFVASGREKSSGLGGWSEARLLLLLERTGGADGWVVRRGLEMERW